MPGKSQRPWRKELKKQQRKRRRRKAAEARDSQLEEEEARMLADPAYQELRQQQAQLEETLQREEERRHAQEEEDWKYRNLLAQRAMHLKQKQLETEEAAAAAKRKQEEAELAVKLADEKRRRQERERRQAAAAAEFDKMMQHMEAFLNNTGPAPGELRRTVESLPGERACTLYESTNCCGYGTACVRNHRRPLLANVIVVRHFFMHPLLDDRMHREYACADGCLELNELDLYETYNAFYEDVVPELEEFGVMRNFRALRNVARHMRGNVFIEYLDERAALKAFIKLQGRFYAGKQLNVEFSSITKWESAVCGLASKGKCKKGNKCLYFHLLTNPGNQYNTPLVMGQKPGNTTTVTPVPTPLLSWDTVTSSDVQQKSRNWRWSESPERQLSAATSLEKAQSEKSNEREDSSGSNRSKSRDSDSSHMPQSEGSKTGANDDYKPQRHRRKQKKSNKKQTRKHSPTHKPSDERNNLFKEREKEKHENKNSNKKNNRSSECEEEQWDFLDIEESNISDFKFKEGFKSHKSSNEWKDDERRHQRSNSEEYESAYTERKSRERQHKSNSNRHRFTSKERRYHEENQSSVD